MRRIVVVYRPDVNPEDVEGTLLPILNAFDEEHYALWESRVANGVGVERAAQQVLKLWLKFLGVDE